MYQVIRCLSSGKTYWSCRSCMNLVYFYVAKSTWVRKTVSIWWAAGVLRNPIVSVLVHCTGINLHRTKGLVLTSFFWARPNLTDGPWTYLSDIIIAENNPFLGYPLRLLVYVSRNPLDTIMLVDVICNIIKLVLADVVSKLCLSGRTQLEMGGT
jgi:hypothetical protein